jgi:hypothetical protein
MTSNLENESKIISNTDQVNSNVDNLENNQKNNSVNNQSRNETSKDSSPNVLFESNEKESIKLENQNPQINVVPRTTQNSNSNNYLIWAIYVSVIFVICYNLSQTNDPIKIGIALAGGFITIFLAKRLLTIKTYKVEDDDNGSNLIEGF